MAEMEKEGRPPENKRSRKPAHPVKREINEEMKVKAAPRAAAGRLRVERPRWLCMCVRALVRVCVCAFRR